MIVGSHVQPLRAQTKISRSKEPQILSVCIPSRPHRIGQPIRHLFCFAGLGVAHKNCVIHRTQTAGVRNPLRVRTPDGIERALRHHPGIAADDFCFAARNIEHPDMQSRVREDELLRIRRPGWRVIMRRMFEHDLARRRQSVLRFDVQAILARLVAEIRNEFSIRRPCGIAFGRTARIG